MRVFALITLLAAMVLCVSLAGAKSFGDNTGPIAARFSAPPGPPHEGGRMGPPGPPPFGGRHFGKRGAMREALIKELGLTKEQRDRMRTLKVSSRNQTRKARTNLMSLRDEKKTMLMSGKIDMQRLTKIDEEMVKDKTALLQERLKSRRERLKILTPEQIEKLADMMASGQFRGLIRGFMGGGRRHGRRF